MANLSESKFSCTSATGSGKETFCIETNRILDSCRDRDCFENVKVFLTDLGREIIDHTGAVRVKSACITETHISLDPVQFNRGFYTVNIRYYIKLLFEACVGGNKPHEFEGVVAVDKKVVLFGGEKNVNVFKSDCEDLEFCTSKEVNSCASRMPKAVVEATDPIVLDVKVFEKGSMPACSCCCCCDIPEKVMSQLEVPITDIGNDCERYLTVSLGIFSVIRLTRSAQLLVNATEYCVPDKECVTPCEENPCAIFNNMVFPTGEFCSQIPKEITSCSLKCK